VIGARVITHSAAALLRRTEESNVPDERVRWAITCPFLQALDLLMGEVFFTSPRLANLATQAEVLSQVSGWVRWQSWAMQWASDKPA
jgi:hypothetical protein